MKKYIVFILLLISATVSAKQKEYIPGEPWPENGYDISYYATGIQLYIKRFVDNDTLYYLKMKYPGDRKNDNFYFITIPRSDVDSLLINIMTTQKLKKLGPKTRYMNKYLDKLKEETVYRSTYDSYYNINNTQWTYYEPKKKQTFNSKTAAVAYVMQRKPKNKSVMSFDEWTYFYENMKMALKLLGSGADTRTLYDKVMQSGGY